MCATAQNQDTYFGFIKSISLDKSRLLRQKNNGEMKLPKTLEPITCPNPKCNEKIEELVIVTNASKTPKEQYYACPHCYTKLDWISTQPREQEDEKKMEKKGPSRCPNHFGYLAMQAYLRGLDFPIPRECLSCQRALDCAMETSDS